MYHNTTIHQYIISYYINTVKHNMGCSSPL